MVISQASSIRKQLGDHRSTLWACFRLARFHTMMGYVVFTAPAILTAILYHGAHPSGDIMHRTWSLIWRLFVCIMFYRGAGLAWDDIIDCKVDARVARTKTRPIPSGAISMAGAVSFCVILTMFTGVLFVNMLPPAVAYANLVGAAVFVAYPFLKFYTYWAQLGGAILIAAISPMAWVACAAWPTNSSAIMVASKNDWQLLISSFVVEMLFSFVHETVYGCQDTPEDLALGVFSVSILFGYAGSKRIVMALTVIYLGVLCSALCAADLHWLVLSVIPAYVLLTEAYRVRMDDPKSCGIYARRALYAKIAVCITAALDLAYIHM